MSLVLPGLAVEVSHHIGCRAGFSLKRISEGPERPVRGKKIQLECTVKRDRAIHYNGKSRTREAGISVEVYQFC